MRTILIGLFTAILISMLAVTGWASVVQPLWQWTGLTSAPNHAWTWATLCDAYFGFITFYVWVFYKEPRAIARVSWFIAIMLLGNMAMAVYVLNQLRRLPAKAPLSELLVRRHA